MVNELVITFITKMWMAYCILSSYESNIFTLVLNTLFFDDAENENITIQCIICNANKK